MVDRILVFHRGIGTAHLKGILFEEKLDLLCEYTVLRAYNFILSFVPEKWGGRKKAKAAGGGGTEGGAGALRALKPSATLARQFSTLAGEVVEGQYIASTHKYAKVGLGCFGWGRLVLVDWFWLVGWD